MIGRKEFAMLLAGAIGTPYLVSSGVDNLTRSDSAQQEGAAASALAPSSTHLTPGSAPSAATAVADLPVLSDSGVPAIGMEEAFRFDLTTPWVLGHWPRVSAGLADVDLQGYRAPLVTGTQPDDLAGSLTYYFNKRQRLQRITFFGTTGDTRRLVALLALRHHFVRELSRDPSLFLYRVRENRKVISELRIKPTSVVRADTPRSRFEIALLIERPEALDDE